MKIAQPSSVLEKAPVASPVVLNREPENLAANEKVNKPADSGSGMVRSRIAVLQVLRAIAALMVAQSHVVSTAAGLGVVALQVDLASFRHLGAMGVDLFFAISGFIVPLTALRSGGLAHQFLLRRAVRIDPIWWIVVLLTVGLRLAAGIATGEWLGSVPWSLTLLPARDSAFIPAVYLGWSLIFEVCFYLLIVAMWGASPRGRLWRMLSLLSVMGGAGLIVQPQFPLAHTLCNPILLEFAMGVVIGIWWTSGRPIARWVGAAALAAGTLWLLATGYLGFPEIYDLSHILDGSLSPKRLLFWGLPSALVVLGCVVLVPSCKSAPGRLAVALGDASYSIYLTSVITQSVLHRSFPYLSWLPGDAMILVGVAAMALVGYGFYRLVELPLMNWAGAHFRAPSRQTSTLKPGSMDSGLPASSSP